MSSKPKALMIASEVVYQNVLGPQMVAELSQLVDLDPRPYVLADLREDPSALRSAELLITGWGAPRFDEEFLRKAPRLKAIFYAAGAMGAALTPGVWERGIVVTSANAMNAIPVAQFTVATILLSLKHTWRLMRETREQRQYPNRDDVPGAYRTVVGLLSMGQIARRVAEWLRPFDLNVIAHDPHLSPEQARAMGVTLVTMQELFDRSDVLSVHTPSLPETNGLIGADLLNRLKPGATLINTARGEIMRQDEMLEVARRRTDLQFVLDVFDPDPLPPDSPFYTLSNVVITPHMAGSSGPERLRMGRFILEEVRRYLAGEALQGEITPEAARFTAHRPVDVSLEPFVNVSNRQKYSASASRERRKSGSMDRGL